jgi:hypothetical protein
MRIKLLPAILVALLVAGCYSCKKSSGPAEVAKGDVQVLVTYQTLPEFPNGAEIYSDPPGISGFTDGTASVLIRDVPVGTYQIYCYKQGYGGGKSAVGILANQLTAVVIILMPGYDPGVAPIIDQVIPADSSQFSPTDTITFSVTAHDKISSPENLVVNAQSNVDGLIFQGHPDNTGVAIFRKKLSRNTHTVTFTVTNPRNFSAHAVSRIFVSLPDRIHLNPPVAGNQKVQLSWTKYAGSDFDHYEVYSYEYGSSPNLLVTLPDANTTSYTDVNPLMTDTAYYYVSVVNKSGQSSQSNVQAVGYPSGFILFHNILSACIDPDGTFIYVAGEYSIYKINYLAKAVVAQWDYPFGSIPYDTRIKLEVADNGLGKELYVCFSQGAVYFLNTSNLHSSYHIFTDLGMIDISTSGDGYIYMVPAWDSYSESGKIVSFQRNPTHVVDSIHFDYNVGVAAIHCIPGGHDVVALHGSQFMHIYHDATGHFSNVTYRSTGLQQWQLFPFSFSPNGNFFITGTESRIYSTDGAFSYKGLFDSNGLTGGTCEDYNNNIFVTFPYNHTVVKSTYPSTGGTTFYYSRGYPKFVQTDWTNLVVLSSTDIGLSNSFLVEVVALK